MSTDEFALSILRKIVRENCGSMGYMIPEMAHEGHRLMVDTSIDDLTEAEWGLYREIEAEVERNDPNEVD